MREALNSNPVVQIAVIGVLILVVGLFMMMNLKKGSGSSSSDSDTAGTSTPATSASALPGASGVPGTSTGTAPAQVPGASASTPGSSPAVPPTSGTVSPEALVPGPGLPRQVMAEWKRGNAIVLLVVRGGGIDDRLVRGSVQSLSGDPGVSVFVARAKNVARYSRITQGVGVDRVPALVVVRPRSATGAVPEAQVSYGFRDTQSIVQAVDDALYAGRDNLPYSPR